MTQAYPVSHKLWKFITPHKNLLLIRVLLALFLAIVALGGRYSGALIVRSITENNRNLMYYSVIFLIAWMLTGVIFSAVNSIIMSKISFRSIEHMRNEVFVHTLKLPTKFYHKTSSGEIITRVTNDIDVINRFISEKLIHYFNDPFRLVIAIIFLSYIHWQLLLITCLVIPGTLYLPKLITKSVEEKSRRQQEELERVNNAIHEQMNSVELIKSYGLYAHISENFNEKNNNALKHTNDLSKTRLKMIFMSSVASYIPIAIILIAGAWFSWQQSLELYQLSLFILSVGYLSEPIAHIPFLYGDWKQARASFVRLTEISEHPVESEKGIVTAKEDRCIIRADNLSFSYNGYRVLKNVTFEIEANSITAFVGHSGSGKSTMLALMSGMYDDYEGSLILFGVELREWNLNELRRRISCVFQDSFIFPMTVADNISLKSTSIPDEKIIESATSASADVFINELDNGYLEMLTERGTSLSGGEKQRINIARALAKESQLLLLDEATAALDMQNEKNILGQITGGTHTRTLVLSTHRLTPVALAGQIIVFDQGSIHAIGTHEVLLESCNLYKQLNADMVV